MNRRDGGAGVDPWGTSSIIDPWDYDGSSFVDPVSYDGGTGADPEGAPWRR